MLRLLRWEKATFSARLSGDRVFIDSFRAESGPGNITGKAEILLRDWTPAEYRGSIKGKRFQTVYLPELQMLSNPEIDFEGDDKKLSVRGEITVPELTVLGREEPAPVKPSKDVIIVDAPKPKQHFLFRSISKSGSRSGKRQLSGRLADVAIDACILHIVIPSSSFQYKPT